MKKIIVKIATVVIVLGLVGGIIYWKSLPEEDVSIETVYTEEYQNDVADELESKKSLNDYDENHMLIEYNPFKTNTLSLYVYFNTEEATKVSYTVKASETDYEDFSANVDGSYRTEHEFQVLGLTPGTLNEVEFAIEDEDGNTITRTYEYTTSSLLGNEDVQLEEMNSTVDSVDIGNGLFAFMGNDSDEQDFMYYYDEDEDWDWMHINTLQWLEDGSVILSSRETSTIIKINDLETNPSIDYLIGEESFWSDTEYADYLLMLTSEFSNTGGQHSVTYMRDDSLEDGQYYLYLFNNNYGVSTTRSDYDWTQIEGIETKLATEGDTEIDSVSYFYQYLVDENEGTYSLVQSFEIPYSGIVSSVQRVDDYIITDSGMQGVLGIYDAQGNLLKQYKSMLNKKYIYRIYYYDFDGFYFNI